MGFTITVTLNAATCYSVRLVDAPEEDVRYIAHHLPGEVQWMPCSDMPEPSRDVVIRCHGDRRAALRAIIGRMKAVAMRSGLLGLHCTAVRDADGCVLFLGSFGSGKTEASLHLALAGYRICSGDFALVDVRRAELVAATPAIYVRGFSADVLERLIGPVSQFEKRDFSSELAAFLAPHSVRVTTIVVLEQSQESMAAKALRQLGTQRAIGELLRSSSYLDDKNRAAGPACNCAPAATRPTDRLPEKQALAASLAARTRVFAYRGDLAELPGVLAAL